MRTEATSAEATRHRLLEGVLLRLARRQDASEFVLRGGMLLRHWFRPVPRPAEDLDLVALFPFSVEEAARRFLPVFAGAADDGVVFDVERLRVEGIFLETGAPGVRIFASGEFDGTEDDFHVDLTFGPTPRPAPVFAAIPTACGESARVWACRPEAVAGQKVQALLHLGATGWRQKDLDDLRLLLARVPMHDIELRAAVLAYAADLGRSLDDVRAPFGPDSWWGMKLSSARWMDYVRESPGRDVPRDLAGVVAGVAERLTPILEDAR